MVKASDLLVAALENEGVERIFGIPGEENLDVVESLRKSSIQLVLTRHEQAAAFMALRTVGVVSEMEVGGFALLRARENCFARLAGGLLRAIVVRIDAHRSLNIVL